MESSNIKIEIKGYGTTKLEHSDSKTVYKMVITKGEHEWDIRRSFTDFCDFHSLLKAITANLPKLPKKYISSITKVSELDKRQAELQIYA